MKNCLVESGCPSVKMPTCSIRLRGLPRRLFRLTKRSVSKTIGKKNSAHGSLPKRITGFQGLDEITSGGLPRGANTSNRSINKAMTCQRDPELEMDYRANSSDNRPQPIFGRNSMSYTRHHPIQHEQYRENQREWKRAHHDWKFWVALSLMLTSMLIDIVTWDETVRPETQNPQHLKQPLRWIRLSTCG